MSQSTRAKRVRVVAILIARAAVGSCTMMPSPRHSFEASVQAQAFGSFNHRAPPSSERLNDFVQSATQVPLDEQDGSDAARPNCRRRSEALPELESSASGDVTLSLLKRHPGREAGPQSNGSQADSRATKEPPSAETPKPLLLDPGEAACKGS